MNFQFYFKNIGIKNTKYNIIKYDKKHKEVLQTMKNGFDPNEDMEYDLKADMEKAIKWYMGMFELSKNKYFLNIANGVEKDYKRIYCAKEKRLPYY